MATLERPPSFKADQSTRQLAEHIQAWRRLIGLTQDQLAQRAGVSRGAYVRLETGQSGVSADTLIRVLNALQLVEGVLKAADPYESDLGRARAGQNLPQRVRR